MKNVEQLDQLFETALKKWYKVSVTFSDGTKHEDEIQGISPKNALFKAQRNWKDAEEISVYYD